MKTSFNRLLTTLVLAIVFTSIFFNGKAQEKAYWQDMAYYNPAIIGTNSDWLYGIYAFSNHDNILSGFELGADYKLGNYAGTFGVFVNREKVENYSRSLYQLNYSYPIEISSTGILHLGVSGGIVRDKYEEVFVGTGYGYGGYGYGGYGGYGEYNPYGYGYVDPGNFYNYDTGSIDNNKNSKYIKTNLGAFYISEKFDFGLSYLRFDELEDDIKLDIYEPDNYLSVQAAYHFHFDKFVIDPNALINITEEDIDRYIGAFVEYAESVWVGYTNYNTDEVHSLMAGIDIKRKYRLGFQYDFTEKFGDERIRLYSFMLAYRIN